MMARFRPEQVACAFAHALKFATRQRPGVDRFYLVTLHEVYCGPLPTQVARLLIDDHPAIEAHLRKLDLPAVRLARGTVFLTPRA